MTNAITVQQIFRRSRLIPPAGDVLRSVGKVYAGREDNLRKLAGEHTLFAAVHRSSEVLGVLLAGQLDSAYVEGDYNRYLAPRRIDVVGVVELMDMGVRKNLRRQGIATELVSFALDSYQFADRIITVSRYAGDDADSSLGILLRSGFQVLRVVDGYYCGAKTFECPDCGGSCICSGYIMERNNRH